MSTPRPSRSVFPVDGVVRRGDGSLGYAELPRSVVHLLAESTERFADVEAVVVVGERLTYGDLWDRASTVAGGLIADGVRRGDRVAIALPNGSEWIIAFFAIQLAGAIAVPVNTRFSPSEVQYVLDDSGATFTFRPDVPVPAGAPYVDDSAGLDEVAAIFYTSGTTGFPKGAMLSHENLLSNVETCIRCVPLDRDAPPRSLISVPFFHVTATNSQLLPTLRLGGTAVVLPTFDVQQFLATLVGERIDTVVAVPAIYWLAMNQPNIGDFDLSAVKTCTYGGAPTPPHVIARLREVFPSARLGNGYGLTETSSVATFLPDQFCDERPETVGLASPVAETALADVDPHSGVGELLIRGQCVALGYWNNREATEAAIIDGWLHTGDVARIDDDGFVQIVDRAKDMVNRGGENVYCVEVENALLEHPSVFDAAVVGVPDEMMGEKVGAVVVIAPGARLGAAELVAFLAGRIADFKVPQYVSFRDGPLPRNAGGKLLKPRLRAETRWGSPVR